MSRRRIAFLALTLTFVALLACAGAAGTWLLYTESGLAWLAARATVIAGKGLTLDSVAGTLAGGMRAQQIRYVGEDIEVRVTDAYLRLSPWSLVMLTPRISELRAAELAVVTKPSEPRERPPDTLALPLSFQLPDARVGRLVIDLGKGPIDLTNVQLEYSGGRSKHEVHALSLNAFDHAIRLRGAIDAHPPFALDGTASATGTAPLEAAIDASVSGNLTELTIKAAAKSGAAELKADARVQPYEAFPLAQLNAGTTGLDLRAFVKALPRTAIEGELELTRKGVMLAGPVRLTNAASGPYDRGLLPVSSLRIDVRTDTAEVREFDLIADLGKGGGISGSGKLLDDGAQLALRTKNLNLAGLHARMRETRLVGRADMTLEQAQQSVTAEVAQDDLSARFAAKRAGERIDVPQFTARARGGEASGAARLDLSGQRRYSLDASFARFDPAAWGSFPRGSINGTVSAIGTIEGPSAEIRLAIRDSRWLEAPLTAQGTLSLAGERLRQADVDATIGGNHIVAQGAFGAPRDTLDLRIDARRLDVFDVGVKGAVRGTAQVSGTWRAPSVRFDLAANDLAHARYGRVKALIAKGAVVADPGGAFDVDASAQGIVAPDWELRSAALRIEGTRASHAGTLVAKGEKVDFRASARGGWRAGTGWSGTLEELVNSGEAAVRLVAPVALAVGPQRVQTQAFELRIVGGSLHVERVAYDRGQLSTAGRFNDVPLRPLIALAGAPAAMAGTLRLSGSWSIASAPRLLGAISVTRESGDLALGSEKFQLGLQTLAANAKFTEQGAVFDARLRSAIATANAEGRASPVAGRYTGASPIAFTADVDVARLAPFAALTDTAMLLDGALRAKLQGSGTLANPLVTGPITGERIFIALPAEGIELKGGTLKGELTQREIRVESFSIRGGEGVFTAQGTLARAGFSEASVDWRADKFTVLGRPDRRLVVTGKGNAALAGGKLAFTGSLRANEGLFELATTTLPTLGDDVVIVGREPAAQTSAAATPVAEKRTTRTAVDMTLDLGNDVHLRGRGLDVWLSGEMRVQTDALGQLRATGSVDARRGTFVAYGQRLEIERGRLYFNGPVNNPALDIVAMRKRQSVEAGVAITGTMSRPLVRVVSNPPLPEGEALSWLILGRAPDQAGAGQLSALPLATNALVDKVGGPIARALHLDDLGLRSGGAQQFLTVGKRLTDRLYLAFDQSLGGTENLLRLEMSLTQRIALRAQAGTTSSLGVFYRYFWD
jgi:translocation and assembly module TamB